MGTVVTSGNLGGVMVRILAQIARDVGSILALGSIFPILITSTILIAVNMILYKLCCMVVEPTLGMFMYGHCLCVCNCKHNKTYNSSETIVIVGTDLSASGKELHRQVGVGTVVTSGSLGGVMVNIPAWNARDVGSIPSLGTIFPIFITPTTIYVSEC